MSIFREHCIKKSCQYFFNVDSVAQMDSPTTLQFLIEQNRYLLITIFHSFIIIIIIILKFI